jgi:hypothetical protein
MVTPEASATSGTECNPCHVASISGERATLANGDTRAGYLALQAITAKVSLT